MIGDRQQRIRMRVVDKLCWNERMEQRFDRRIGRLWILFCDLQGLAHIAVRHRCTMTQGQKVIHSQRRKARWLNSVEIPPAALNIKHVWGRFRAADTRQFDGGISAAMDNQRPIPAQQARRIDTERQVAPHALTTIAPHDGSGFAV